MFERYTEKARRVIFFARYEASQFGASAIEAEHILLGLLREDANLTEHFLPEIHNPLGVLRKEVEARTPAREKVSTSVDLPLAAIAKRVLGSAQEASEQLGHRYVGTEHLLLGLLAEEQSIAAEILRGRGLSRERVLVEIERAPEQVWSDAELDRAERDAIPYAHETRTALGHAAEECRTRGDVAVRPEHVLVGLLQEGRSAAARLLEARGLDVDEVRRALFGEDDR